ncbi:hypothetical protein Tco_0261369 [Tanacetum coccineum]
MTLDIQNWSSSVHHEIHKIVNDEIFPIVNQVDARFQNFKIQFLKEVAKFVRDFKSLAKEDDESLAKHKSLKLEIKRLLRAVVSQDIMSIVQSNSVVSEQKDITKGTSVNTQFRKQTILGKPPSSSGSKLYVVTPFLKSKGLSKIDKTHALSKPVTSHSVPTPQESTVVNNERVIALGIFRINPFKAPRVDNFVPNKHVKASVRTKPITISQPHVIHKKDVNSITNGFSPKNVESTTRTRRPQPRNNPKSDKVPFKSKSSCLSNKLEKIEENHRKKNQSANVSKSANQKKHKANVMKSKTLSSEDRLASSRPSKPRSFLRRSYALSWKPCQGDSLNLPDHRLKAARDRQKSYADKRRRPLEFSVGDYVLLKVSPWKGVVRFGKKEKLAPRFVRPFEITERIGPVAYRLRLPEELNGFHDTFHVSNLKKCLADPTLQVPLDEIQIDSKLNFVEEPVEVLEKEFKKLKRSRIAIVKVRWNSKRGPEFTWEREDQMKLKYPHLFSDGSS